MVPSTLGRFPRVLTLTMALVIAPSCNSGGPSASSPTKAGQFRTVAACTLASETDATTAVGTPMAGGIYTWDGARFVPGAPSGASDAAEPSLCYYVTKETSGISQKFVFVLAAVYPDQTTAGAVNPDRFTAVYRSRMSVSNSRAVNGIGDRAVEYTAATSLGNGIAIFVFRANVVLMIAAAPTDDSAKLEALAREAVTNLDKTQKSSRWLQADSEVATQRTYIRYGPWCATWVR